MINPGTYRKTNLKKYTLDTKSEKTATWEPRKNTQNSEKYPGYDKLSDQGYTSLPKPDESESGQMVLKWALSSVYLSQTMHNAEVEKRG